MAAVTGQLGASRLLEREPELERLDELIRQTASGEGRLVLIEGEAGIGKTALLEALIERADTGFVVLSARGADLEREFSHGVVRQLYEPIMRGSAGRRRKLLSGAAELAAPALGLTRLGEGGLVGPDARHAANHGLYWLTANLAEQRPLVLVVDDAHWADSATLMFLNYLGRRLEGVPVLVALGLRPAEPGSQRELLEALRELESCDHLRPRPLSQDATAKLIQAILGQAAEERFLVACLRATGGNPFLLGELLRALAGEGVEPSDTAVEHVSRLGPRSISRSVLGRLASLWPQSVSLAQAAAVLDTDAELGHAARLAGLDLDAAEAAADALTDAHVLAPGRPLRFAHPILRQAVYEDLPQGRRFTDHARAARLLDAAGDPDRAAMHLLPTEPVGDEWAVGRLRAAAGRAVERGAPAEAATLLRRALREPPPLRETAAVLLELGRAARLAGDSEAIDLLSEALERASNTSLRVAAAEELATAEFAFGDLERGAKVLETAADAIADSDWEGRLRLEGALLNLSANSDSVGARVARRIERLLPDLSGHTPFERVLVGGAAWHQALDMSAPAQEIFNLAQRAAADLLIVDEHPAGSIYYVGPCAGYIAGDRFDLYETLVEAEFDKASRAGSASGLALAWVMRARLAHLRGDMPRTEECARSAMDIAPAHGPAMRYHVVAHLVTALLWQGKPEDADAELRQHGLACDAVASSSPARMLLVARAHASALAGRKEQALADAREATGRAVQRGTSYLITGSDWSTALALNTAGAHPEAIVEARRELELARTVGGGIEGLGALVCGLVDESGRALAWFEEAVAKLDGTPRNFDKARALVELGAALRRANRRSDAREPLRRGMDLAQRCGVALLAQRAREELLACGARPRKLVVTGVDSLTASERRVARLAAEGLSNVAIAQTLFVTKKTIETHLGHVYRKLDIASREQLDEALSGAH